MHFFLSFHMIYLNWFYNYHCDLWVHFKLQIILTGRLFSKWKFKILNRRFWRQFNFGQKESKISKKNLQLRAGRSFVIKFWKILAQERDSLDCGSSTLKWSICTEITVCKVNSYPHTLALHCCKSLIVVNLLIVFNKIVSIIDANTLRSNFFSSKAIFSFNFNKYSWIKLKFALSVPF